MSHVVDGQRPTFRAPESPEVGYRRVFPQDRVRVPVGDLAVANDSSHGVHVHDLAPFAGQPIEGGSDSGAIGPKCTARTGVQEHHASYHPHIVHIDCKAPPTAEVGGQVEDLVAR